MYVERNGHTEPYERLRGAAGALHRQPFGVCSLWKGLRAHCEVKTTCIDTGGLYPIRVVTKR